MCSHDSSVSPEIQARIPAPNERDVFVHDTTGDILSWNMVDIPEILRKVAFGQLSVEKATEMMSSREDDLGFARVDLDRRTRCGLSEAIFAEGKTGVQILAVMDSLLRAGQGVLVTRLSSEFAVTIQETYPDAVYHQAAKVLTLGQSKHPPAVGRVGVVCAGTSDIPVAEEAALTAEWMGASVERIQDVGVAGLHRLASRLDLLRSCRVVVVVAGMEGALPSVVGGLIARPIVAVPTSIGYGANLHGLSALLAMLNACVAGISVVNIDNGFGAGVAAGLINRIGEHG